MLQTCYKVDTKLIQSQICNKYHQFDNNKAQGNRPVLQFYCLLIRYSAIGPLALGPVLHKSPGLTVVDVEVHASFHTVLNEVKLDD